MPLSNAGGALCCELAGADSCCTARARQRSLQVSLGKQRFPEGSAHLGAEGSCLGAVQGEGKALQGVTAPAPAPVLSVSQKRLF